MVIAKGGIFHSSFGFLKNRRMATRSNPRIISPMHVNLALRSRFPRGDGGFCSSFAEMRTHIPIRKNPPNTRPFFVLSMLFNYFVAVSWEFFCSIELHLLLLCVLEHGGGCIPR